MITFDTILKQTSIIINLLHLMKEEFNMKKKKWILIGAMMSLMLGGIIGSKNVSISRTGIVKENTPMLTTKYNANLTKKNQTKKSTNKKKSSKLVGAQKEVNKLSEDELWEKKASEVLKKYFDIDTSDTKPDIRYYPAEKDHYNRLGYSCDEVMVLFYLNNSDNFYNVIFDQETGEILDAYDNFSDCYLTQPEVEVPVGLEESKKMAKNFILEKELGEEGKLEYIGGRITSEGRIHVAYKLNEEVAIMVGIDTFSNKIRSFYKLSIENAKEQTKILRPEDLKG